MRNQVLRRGGQVEVRELSVDVQIRILWYTENDGSNGQILATTLLFEEYSR